MYNIIFDFDGVFGNSWNSTVHANMQMTNNENKSQVEAELRNVRLVIPRYTEKEKITENEFEQLIKFRNEEYKIKDSFGNFYFNEFINVVRQLPEGSRLAIVSTAHQDALNKFVEYSKLHFTHVIGFQKNFSKIKFIKEIINEWRVLPEDVFFVTDTIRDVVEIKNILPLDKIVGVNWGFHGYSFLRTVLPDASIIMKATDFLYHLKSVEPESLEFREETLNKLESDHIKSNRIGIVKGVHKKNNEIETIFSHQLEDGQTIFESINNYFKSNQPDIVYKIRKLVKVNDLCIEINNGFQDYREYIFYIELSKINMQYETQKNLEKTNLTINL
jgi:phosphoglycolate phosphatase-like HAD superfamily hydrolase